ncbi:MAG: TonB-dependent receptor, partial [Candidatus Binataceae bacterium]
GGLLEAVGRLFQRNVKVYLYPYKDPESGQLITAETLRIPTQWHHLYAHLLENKLIEPIEGVDERSLSIFPRDVLAKIQGGDAAWETMVPPPVVGLIKERGYFGHRPTPATRDKSPAAR